MKVCFSYKCVWDRINGTFWSEKDCDITCLEALQELVATGRLGDVDPKDLRMVFCGKEVTHEEYLADYHMERETCVHLLLKMK